MSYDTTVHEALEPPHPRVAEAATAPKKQPLAVRRILPVAWRPLLASSAMIFAFIFVTWVVAAFTAPPASEHSDGDVASEASLTAEAAPERDD